MVRDLAFSILALLSFRSLLTISPSLSGHVSWIAIIVAAHAFQLAVRRATVMNQ